MRNFETESPLQIEKEDHAILNGLPLSFSPRSCDCKRYGRSSMASVQMVAFFEVADSVRVCLQSSTCNCCVLQGCTEV